MKKLKFWRLIPVAILSVGLITCDSGPSGKDGEDTVVAEDTLKEELENEGQNVVYYGTPSLIEVATIMKESGAKFSNDLLHDPSMSKNYATQNKKALNLGVYGADLTYSAMFEETQESINYLKTIKSLAEDMGMTGAFETDFLESIESNITNRDSLLDIITDFYWSADSYLMDNERSEVASLIIVGGWVESMFIACDMAQNSPKNILIKQRIGEQKLILKNLILFLGSVESQEEDVADALAKLKEIQGIYNEVNLTHSEVSAKTDAGKGETVLGSNTEVVIDQKHLDALCQKLNDTRISFIQ